jgi:hypothetical protein
VTGHQSPAGRPTDGGFTDGEPSDGEAAVMLRVVKGDPTDKELAALVAVLAARQAGAARDQTPGVRRSGWSARERGLRGVHRRGLDGWRAAARPR